MTRVNLQKDLKEFIELLSAHDVRYVIVGAFAAAYHGYPRYTADIDIFVDNSLENAERILRVLHTFGFGDIGLAASDFTVSDQVIQLGVAPNRIDLLTSLSGVSFEEVWSTLEQVQLGGLTIPFISRQMLIRNKTARGRTQDLADLEHLYDTQGTVFCHLTTTTA